MKIYGLLASRPGVDVDNADIKDLSFSSEAATPKIVKIMYFDSAGGTAAHGLNYPPEFDAFLEFEAGRFYRIDSLPAFSGIGIEVDAVNVYASAGNAKYIFIFADSLLEED